MNLNNNIIVVTIFTKYAPFVHGAFEPLPHGGDYLGTFRPGKRGLPMLAQML
jgi:hypothetical protein